jgi:DNA mismatch endonuclease (patch repair protein)
MVDNMSSAQRRRTMSRIRSKNTRPELLLRQILYARGMRYNVHVCELPGKPDIVFRQERIAVFVDGDYWHGWRFPCWRHKLSSYWRQKIAGNRKRDTANRRKLRRSEWLVIRLWEHNIERNPKSCADFIQSAVRERRVNGRTAQSPTRVKTKGRVDVKHLAGDWPLSMVNLSPAVAPHGWC